MAWLGTRLLKRSQNEEPDAAVEEAPAPRPEGPSLVVLIPYVAGVSSFHSYHFHDTASAAAFIEASVPPEMRRGMHAFWALQEELPAGASEGDEAMVLIRTADESDQVYVVSFVDVASAQSFARFEVKRGLNVGLISIYWAHLVNIEESATGVRLTPEAPPESAASVPPPPHALRTHQVEIAPPAEATAAAPAPPRRAAAPRIAIPEDNDPELNLLPETPAAEATPAAEGKPVPAVTGETAPEKPVPEEIEEAGAAGIIETLPDEETGPEEAPEPPAAEEPLTAAPEEALEAEVCEPAPPLADESREAAIEETVFARDGDGAHEAVEVPAMFALDAPVETVIGDEELSGEAWPLAAQPLTAPGGDESADSDAMAAEIERILRVKRWNKREDPFKGFDSPPGRF